MSAYEKYVTITFLQGWVDVNTDRENEDTNSRPVVYTVDFCVLIK